LSFFDRFEIRSIVSQRCLRARDKVTGLNVLVHAVSPDRELVALLKRTALLVCEGTQDGVEYAATPDRQELLDLTVWKTRQRIPPDLLVAPLPSVDKPDDTPKPKPAGDFTVMFRVPNAARHRDEPAPSVQRNLETTAEMKIPAGIQDAEQPPPKQEPGEFTAMFQVPAAEAPQPRKPAENAGEFTSMFRAPVAPSPEPAPPPPGSGAGEFTAMFRTPAPEARQTPGLEPQPLPSGTGAGEFTAMFRSRAPEPPQIPDRPRNAIVEHPAVSDEKTRLFEAPPSTPPRAEPAPSEFTRLFQASPSSPSSLPHSAPAGEFTALFQTPGADAHPAPAAASTDFDRFFNAPYANDPETEGRLRGQGPVARETAPVRDAGEFTRLFGAKDVPFANPAAPAGATGAFATPGGGMADAPPESPSHSGASEYTRLFERPKTEPPPAAAAPAPVPAAAPVKLPSKIPGVLLYVLIGVLACAAIATVLYFALRH
jgi:hypothetical protein